MYISVIAGLICSTVAVLHIKESSHSTQLFFYTYIYIMCVCCRYVNNPKPTSNMSVEVLQTLNEGVIEKYFGPEATQQLNSIFRALSRERFQYSRHQDDVRFMIFIILIILLSS